MQNVGIIFSKSQPNPLPSEEVYSVSQCSSRAVHSSPSISKAPGCLRAAFSYCLELYLCLCTYYQWHLHAYIYIHIYIYIYHPHWTQCNITSHPPRSLADSRFPRLGSHSRVLSTAPARTSWSITELFHAYNLDMFFFGKMGVYSIFRHIHMPVINHLIVIGCPSCKNSKNT